MNKPSEKVYKYAYVLDYIEKKLLPQLAPGDLLPDSSELCQKLNCSLITVNHALRILAERKRIKRVRNRGSVVLAAEQNILPLRNIIRVMGISPNSWFFMYCMETMLRNYGGYHPELEFRFEYPPPEEWKERLLNGGCDLFFGNAQALTSIISDSSLRSFFMPLDKLSGLHFSRSDFPENIIEACSHMKNWRAIPLTISPVIQRMNIQYERFADQLIHCDFYEYCRILETMQRENRPIWGITTSLNYFETFFRAADCPVFISEKLDSERFADKNLQKLLAFCTDLSCRRRLFHVGQLPNVNSPEEIGLTIKWSSALDFSPDTVPSVRILPPPGYWKNYGTPLFLEGVIPGIQSNPDIIVPILNYLQSAAVQFKLRGTTGLPARNDMRELMLANLEPNHPGLTETFHLVMPHARVANLAYNELNAPICERLSAIISGLLPVTEGCRQIIKIMRKIYRKNTGFSDI